MEINLSVQNGTLALTSPDTVCSEDPLEGQTISFQGSLYAINYALSGLVYWVRLGPLVPHVQGSAFERLIACMSDPAETYACLTVPQFVPVSSRLPYLASVSRRKIFGEKP